MNKWSDVLCKTTISTHVLEEIQKECKSKITVSFLESISKDIKNESDFEELERNVKQLKKSISKELFNTVLEELTEIKEDLIWIGSKRGKYIAEINDWAQNFYSEFRLHIEFEDILMGGHSERMVLFLTGKIKGKDAFEKLLQYMESKNPPYKILSHIEIY
ncbi:hypothetical protein [Dokdonia sp.]|uniref:hypothetical protein n=1 Tax=Dokdonia sp. TaxID=2024995 RepID=UPI00326458E4